MNVICLLRAPGRTGSETSSSLLQKCWNSRISRPFRCRSSHWPLRILTSGQFCLLETPPHICTFMCHVALGRPCLDAEASGESGLIRVSLSSGCEWFIELSINRALHCEIDRITGSENTFRCFLATVRERLGAKSRRAAGRCLQNNTHTQGLVL